jgi:hypothetical protein
LSSYYGDICRAASFLIKRTFTDRFWNTDLNKGIGVYLAPYGPESFYRPQPTRFILKDRDEGTAACHSLVF